MIPRTQQAFALCMLLLVAAGCGTVGGERHTPPLDRETPGPISIERYRYIEIPMFGRVKIPSEMPDFAHDFPPEPIMFHYSTTICATAFMTGHITPPFGADGYELIWLCDGNMPLVLAYGEGEEVTFWIYDHEGNPVTSTYEEVISVLGMDRVEA